MGERKVLNKYYPPDFDPSKIPRLRLPRDRQYTVRLMAPFNMRCTTCGEYIYKGKKFNARKETVQNEEYLGIKIFRFYIKCTRCLAEITFKTDPQNTDYECEHGATRNFQAQKFAEEEEELKKQQREEEEMNNPMKALENRTKDSKAEMDMLDTLEEIKDLNARNAKVDIRELLETYHEDFVQELIEKQKDEEAIIQTVFQAEVNKIKRLDDSDEDNDDEIGTIRTQNTNSTLPSKRCTDIMLPDANEPSQKRRKNVDKMSLLSSMVKVKKKPSNAENLSANKANESSNTPKLPSSQGGLGLISNYSGTSSEDDS
ncbi:Coiled-coil domain-containing protein 94 [Trichoplax sp. H2]|nr:Coiled-coil domain-containing protein 94 [Trichoplax sp. H2]|eukprot:RDD45857.1 Coiled-coil domain-containing protein 94 [Trichoplax sp. H2]